jgi:predicted nicotinamide N-methyase
MNDCLLLPSRVFWSAGGVGGVPTPITIKQTMTTGEMWQVSTGSTVWGGGVVLNRYMEGLGSAFWQGQRVIELGTGTGLGGVTAARLGAADVLVTDRDAEVLRLAASNARANLPSTVRVAAAGSLTAVSEQRGTPSAPAFRTSLLEWGSAPAVGAEGAAADGEAAYAQEWDVVVGADLTYNREAWPVLVETIKRLQAPAILSASERREDELKSLASFLTDEGLSFEMEPSPMAQGYAASNVKIFRIAKPPKPTAPTATNAATNAAANAAAATTPAAMAPAPATGGGATAQQAPSAAQRMLAEARRDAEAASAKAASSASPSIASASIASAAPAAPTAKEQAGALLRASFNAPGRPPWYTVDPVLKQQRLDWAYGVVRAKGYDPSQPPQPPAELLRASQPAGPGAKQSPFGEPLM